MADRWWCSDDAADVISLSQHPRLRHFPLFSQTALPSCFSARSSPSSSSSGLPLVSLTHRHVQLSAYPALLLLRLSLSPRQLLHVWMRAGKWCCRPTKDAEKTPPVRGTEAGIEPDTVLNGQRIQWFLTCWGKTRWLAVVFVFWVFLRFDEFKAFLSETGWMWEVWLVVKKTTSKQTNKECLWRSITDVAVWLGTVNRIIDGQLGCKRVLTCFLTHCGWWCLRPVCLRGLALRCGAQREMEETAFTLTSINHSRQTLKELLFF